MIEYKDEKSRELATQSIPKLMLKYAAPAIISMTAMSLYNICDSIFIGRGVGALAIAGLAICWAQTSATMHRRYSAICLGLRLCSDWR